MCGIAGFTTPRRTSASRRMEYGAHVRAMAAALRHRGPDSLNALVLDGVALAHARLAIVDPEGGGQPMRDPETGVTLVYGGEVFNHVELRSELAGYRFRTRCDTEVLLAAYLRWGIECLERLNGQFAFALFDPRDGTLWLARDRVGILPLHYVLTRDGVAFASEAKALFAGGHVAPRLDVLGLKETLQLWAPIAPRTCLERVRALPAGFVAQVSGGRLRLRRWWDLDLGEPPAPVEEGDAVASFGELLADAVRLRLRADVPVAVYLSGGIDSATVTALARRQLPGRLSSFSVEFEDPAFDEAAFQRTASAAIGTDHHGVRVSDALVGALLPEVVAHAEQVLVRAAPAPLLALSREVHGSGGRVVLTGEGSDEILLGYDLYAETQVRQFWARQPRSSCRPSLLQRLHPYLGLHRQGDAALRATYGVGLDAPTAPAFSHLVRWTASSRLWRLLSREVADATAEYDPVAALVATLPARVLAWSPLRRAQYLEMQTLLAGNLLGPQGDRMLMASSVEGRFPFLDHRLIEAAARLPTALKLRGLTGKWVLRKLAAALVPPEIVARPKAPFRSPPARALAGPDPPEWVRDALSPEAIRATGVFDPTNVARLLSKLARPHAPVSEVDAMGITAVATGQLLARSLGRVTVDERVAERVALEVA